VEALVRSVHRRSLTTIAIGQAALAFSLALAGSVVVLLTGTQLLAWYWIFLLASIGVVAGLVRVRNRIPSHYRTAQEIDRKLALYDTISTAWHVRQDRQLANSPAGRWQLARAEDLAGTVDTSRVFPFRLQRSWGITLGLAALAFALFSVRYLVRHDLNFKDSLIPIPLERLTADLKSVIPLPSGGDRADSNSSQKDGQSQNDARTEPNDPRMNDVVGVKNPLSMTAADQGTAPGDPSVEQNLHNSTAASNGKDGVPDTSQQDPADPNAQEARNGGSQDAEGEKQSAQASEKQGEDLVSRMKDAVSNLLAKMRPSEGSQHSSQTATRNAAAPDQDRSQSPGEQMPNRTNASPASQNSAQAESRGQEQGQATELAQSAQRQSSGKSESSGGSQSKSGIGKQDGGKDLKEAEALQAMGKLAEIIGKRSQDISGEMMVETPSGKQQLATEYSKKVGQHADRGGEIERDEIPVMFQEYVREYMDRIHRQPPSKADGGVSHP
jgi:hypothetical protein